MAQYNKWQCKQCFYTGDTSRGAWIMKLWIKNSSSTCGGSRNHPIWSTNTQLILVHWQWSWSASAIIVWWSMQIMRHSLHTWGIFQHDLLPARVSSLVRHSSRSWHSSPSGGELIPWSAHDLLPPQQLESSFSHGLMHVAEAYGRPASSDVFWVLGIDPHRCKARSLLYPRRKRMEATWNATVLLGTADIICSSWFKSC